MSGQRIIDGGTEVQMLVPGFDYTDLLSGVKDLNSITARFDPTDVRYEKVQLFRMLTELRPKKLTKHRIVTKFVNETHHIENEYVMQLNPQIFDAVPEYVVAARTELIDENFPA